jgi:hypothetical protein
MPTDTETRRRQSVDCKSRAQSDWENHQAWLESSPLPISPAVPIGAWPIIAIVIRTRVVVDRRPGIDRRWNVARRRRSIVWSALCKACRNHIAVLALPRSLAPFTAATADVDPGPSGNLRDDARARSRSLSQIDGGVNDRRPPGGRRRSRWRCGGGSRRSGRCRGAWRGGLRRGGLRWLRGGLCFGRL